MEGGGNVTEGCKTVCCVWKLDRKENILCSFHYTKIWAHYCPAVDSKQTRKSPYFSLII